MKASDITAKLLAQENINIVRSNAKTASFDVLARVLTIPLWKDMTDEIEDMMVCHEVGHALFTNYEEWSNGINSVDASNQSVMHGYMNIVEDARIEKLMKRRYPGCRKSFYNAYQQLLAMDFFKLGKKDVNSLTLIDRINIYFKAGASTGVSFSEEEKVLVDKVDRVETLESSIKLANEIYEFSKSDLQSKKHDKVVLKSQKASDESDDATDDASNVITKLKEDSEVTPDTDFSLNKTSPSNDSANESLQKELESQTDKGLNSSMEEHVDDATEYRYYKINTNLSHDPIVSYKKIISDIAEVSIPINANDEFTLFMKESNRIVSYLVKEFEMRKSAQTYQRSQVSKSGSLNMNKIHKYLLTDDIFKTVTSIPNGKNHGMVFLLDWSGSMTGVIDETVKQVINLAMFCRRINIPFEVYAFTTKYSEHNWSSIQHKKNSGFVEALRETDDCNIIFSSGRFNLLNLFSSKMTNNEFNLIAKRFSRSSSISTINGYRLGATPLNESLLYMLDVIPNYKKKNNIEKLSLVVLSDGQGNELYCNNNSYLIDRKYDYDFKKYISIKNIVTDEVTRKTYQIQSNAKSFTQMFLKIIKDRYDVTPVGFYICENRTNMLKEAIKANCLEKEEVDIQEVRSEFRDKGFYSMERTEYTEMFLIPSTSTKIIDADLNVESTESASAIARKFSKNLNTRKHSRILLDRFIGHVS